MDEKASVFTLFKAFKPSDNPVVVEDSLFLHFRLENVKNYDIPNILINGEGIITGEVKKLDKSGNSKYWSRAKVVLIKQDENSTQLEASVDEQGRFQFKNIRKDLLYTLICYDFSSKDATQSRFNVRTGNHIVFELKDVSNEEIKPTHYVSGTVKNYNDQLVSRFVSVNDRETGRLLGSATSNPTTGEYRIEFIPTGKVIVICYPLEDEDVNAKVYDRVVPILIK